MPFGTILASTTSTTTDSNIDEAVTSITGNEDVQSVWQRVVDIATWNPVEIVLIMVVAWVASRLVRRIIRNTVRGLQGEIVQARLMRISKRTPRMLQTTGQFSTLRRAQRAETIGAVLRSVSVIVISVIAVLAILRVLDVNLAPVLAGAGIATAALGFGAQNIVRDFLAGFFIVTEDQYGVGDVIDVGGANGAVESVSLRITRIRAADGTLWHVPNGEIKSVANKSQQWARAVVEFKLDIKEDIPNAIRIMKAEADDMWQDSAYAGIILEEPEVWGPEDVGPYGILLKLVVKVKPMEQWQMGRTLRSRVKRAFEEQDVSFAPLPMAPEPLPVVPPHPGGAK